MNINKVSGAMLATGNGTVTITAKATDGSGKSATCKVIGTVLVNDFWFNQTEHTMYHYQYMQMGYTWTPWNAKDPSLSWKSSDKDIATVDQNGTVYSNNGIWNGSTWITGTTVDGSNITRSFLVHVKEAFVEGISLSPSNLSLNVGDGCGLSWTMWPSYAANKSISWSSSDKSVAAVSGGWVAAKGAGTCTITATTYLGYSASCTVTVRNNNSGGSGGSNGGNSSGGGNNSGNSNNGGNNNNGNDNPRDSGAVSYITMIASKAMIVGENSGIFATISPASSSSKITWSSSDKNIATVNSKGQVTAKKAGTVKITAKAGGRSATCTVTVIDLVNEYAYSFGTDYRKTGVAEWFDDETIDTSESAINAAMNFGIIGYNSHYNIVPTYSFLNGKNPDTNIDRLSSSILLFNGHSSQYSMYFNYQGKGGDYNTQILHSTYTSQVENVMSINIGTKSLDTVKLMVFAGCNTAKGDDNICSNVVDLGATTSIGWQETINVDDSIKWLSRFTENLSLGYTVQKAADLASDYKDYNYNTIKYHKIYGSTDLRIKK